MPRTSPPTTAAALVVLALALSGCSGGDGDASTGDARGTAGSSRTAASSEAPPSSGDAPSSSPAAGSSPGSSAPRTPPATVELSDGVWTLTDVAVERGASSDVVTARVTNGGPEFHTGLFVLTIYAPGSQIAELRGSADLEAGASAVVTFSGVLPDGRLPGDPSSYSYEFVVEATL